MKSLAIATAALAAATTPALAHPGHNGPHTEIGMLIVAAGVGLLAAIAFWKNGQSNG